MCGLSTSAFKATISFLAAKSDVSTPVACSNSFYKSNSTLSLTWRSDSG